MLSHAKTEAQAGTLVVLHYIEQVLHLSPIAVRNDASRTYSVGTIFALG